MLEVDVRLRRGAFALHVAFTTPAPGLIALYGPSGSGKSTTIDLIAGLVTPDAGTVRLGTDTLYDSERGIDVPPERRRIGYVFQDARLFPHLDVQANLRYGERRAPGSVRDIRFEEVVELLLLEGLLARRAHQLSGGERQRVALGRALLSQPRLLLLDEPLAALDLARREELLPYLERLRDRLSIPIIYVSHQFEEVLRLATHVVLLRAGAITAQGDVVALSRHPGLRAVVGTEALGAVVEGEIDRVDAQSGLAQLRVGAGQLNVQTPGRLPGQRVRVQLLARDLILAIEPPRGLSVRNCLEGTIVSLAADEESATQVIEIDVGGARVLAQLTASATAELGLVAGRRVWVLVKAVSLRGHVYAAAPLRSVPAEPARGEAPGSCVARADDG